MASNFSKNLIFGSLSVAGVVALLAVIDLVLSDPFSGGARSTMTMVMDILFILSSAIVAYLGWDAYRDMT
jgi:hypothetical protein